MSENFNGKGSVWASDKCQCGQLYWVYLSMCTCLNVYGCSYVFFWQLTVDAELYTISRTFERSEQLPPYSAKAQLLLRNCRPCCGFLLILFSELHCTAAQRFLLNFPASAVSLLTLSASFSFLFFLSISVACLNQQWSSPGRAVGPTGTLSFPEERQWTSALCSRLGFLPHPGDREKNIWHRNRETPLKML